jgi:hypothetical protein
LWDIGELSRQELPTRLLGNEDVLGVEASGSYDLLEILQGFLVDFRVSACR